MAPSEAERDIPAPPQDTHRQPSQAAARTGPDDHPPVSLASRFAQICHDLQAEPRQQPTLDHIVNLAVDTIPAADACGISLRRPDGTVETPAATSDTVQELDDLQYRLGQGPCLDSVWQMDTNVIGDTTAETRWPEWTPHAVQAGVRSVLSVRLETATNVIGAVNLYARTAHVFDHTDIAVASIFARHAGVALAAADRAESIRAALRSRQTIGVAQGMLMQRYGLDLDQSFEVLRRFSQEQNIKVRDLAQQLALAGKITDGIQDTLSP